MIIEGVIMTTGAPLHLTTTDGKPVTLAMDDAAFVSELVESLAAYIATARPPFLKEHKRDGYRRGEVLEVFEGEDPETKAPGVRARIRVDDPEMQRDAAMIKRLSPFLLTGAQTSDGVVHKWGLAETSAVSVPMVDAGQPDVLIAAASAYGALRPVEDCAILAQTVETSANLAQNEEAPMSMIAELVTALQAATPEELTALRAVLAPAPAPVVEVESAAPPAAPAAPMADPTMIAMSAKIDALTAQLGKFVAVAPTEPVGAIAAAALQRGAIGGGNAPAPKSLPARAREIAAEKNISFRDAIPLAGKEMNR